MKNALAILFVSSACLAAQASTNPAKSAAPAKKPAVAKKATTTPAQDIVIPKDAVANADGTYSWKDKQGKSWLFVKTPFGVMKSASAGTAASSNTMAGVKAFDEGDKVRFERPSPFGPMKWEKSKSELTDEERALVATQTPGSK